MSCTMGLRKGIRCKVQVGSLQIMIKGKRTTTKDIYEL